MKVTDGIAPPVVVENEFRRLHNNAYDSLIALQGFWTKLYGPNEALSEAFDSLSAQYDAFYEVDEEAATTREP